MIIKTKSFDNAKLKISETLPAWIFLFLFLLTQFAFNGHIKYSHISYAMFILLVGLTVVCRKKLRLYYSHYFTTYIAFMVYSFFLMAIGRASYPDIVLSKLGYMFICLVIYIMLYNFIIYSNNMELLFKITIWAAVIALAFIMMNVEDIWTGRLGHSMDDSGPSFVVNGIPVYLTANAIATFADMGALFSLYFVGIRNKKLYLIPCLFLAFGTMLSGSRKGLLLLLLFVMFAIYFYFKGTNVTKFIKLVIGAFAVYYIVIKVPAFYDVIGKRTELLVTSILGGEAEEASMDSRAYLAGLAKNYIYQKPFFGWGLSNFSQLANSPYSVDNNYLDILVSCGVGGLIIYYYYIVLAIKDFIAIKSEHRTMITKTMLYVVLCFLILDFGSVVYTTRCQLIWVVVYFATVAIDKRNSVNLINERKI